jgi:hypothetical protein
MWAQASLNQELVGIVLTNNIDWIRTPKLEDLPQEAIQVLLFFETFCKFSKHTDRKALEGFLPPYILDHFAH